MTAGLRGDATHDQQDRLPGRRPAPAATATPMPSAGDTDRASRGYQTARAVLSGPTATREQSLLGRSNSEAPKVRVGFILGRLQLELDVESRNARWDPTRTAGISRDDWDTRFR
jgi:hypothetical protein